MVKHIILWNLKDEFSPEEKENIKAGIKEGLEGLGGKIEGLVDLANRLDETTEFKYLAGVGVAFMTLIALNSSSVKDKSSLIVMFPTNKSPFVITVSLPIDNSKYAVTSELGQI